MNEQTELKIKEKLAREEFRLCSLAEADKVIAELEKKRDCTIEHAAEVIKAQERELRHHKYKRCLAMASIEWLKKLLLYKYPESILFRRAYRREHKWKELAEKFKEAK